MNILSKVVFRQLKLDRQRFLITIFGVIISTAMIISVLIGYDTFERFMNGYIRQSGGNIHVQINNISAQKAISLIDNPLFIKAGVEEYYVYTTTDDNIKVYLGNVDNNFFSLLNVKLKSGLFPKDGSEVIITQSLADMGYKVGDAISTEETADKTFVVSGIISSMSRYNNKENIVFINQPKNKENCLFMAEFAQIDKKSITQTERLFDEIKKEYPASSLYVNYQLLETQGIRTDNNLFAVLRNLSAFMLVIVGVASVLMIYNSFSMSAAQKRKLLGLFASIGATPRQKAALIMQEALIIGTIAIPVGVVSGYIGVGILFKFLNGYIESFLSRDILVDTTVVFSIKVVMMAVIISALVLFISAYIPALSVAKTSPIEAIRSNGKIKVRRIKTPFFFKKIFGFTGELAVKNQKRNFGRYIITVFSLVIATIVLLAGMAPINLIDSTIKLQSDNFNYNLMVMVSSDEKDLYKKFNEVIENLPKEDTIFIREGFATFDANAEQIKMNKSVKKLFDDRSQVAELIVVIDVIPDQEFISLGGELSQSGGINAIIYNGTKVVINQKRTHISRTTDLVQGDKIPASIYDIPVNIEVSKVINDTPIISVYDYESIDVPTSLCLVAAQSDVEKFLSDNKIEEVTRTANALVVAKNVDSSLAALDRGAKLPSNYFVSTADMSGGFERYQSLYIILTVITYGFTALTATICCSNIANTIFSGVVLRRKEYATLKSVGMSQHSINKMVMLESAVYGIKALIIGVPIGIAVMVLEYKIFSRGVVFDFYIPYAAIAVAIAVIFAVTSLAALPALYSMKNSDIMQELRRESEI